MLLVNAVRIFCLYGVCKWLHTGKLIIIVSKGRMGCSKKCFKNCIDLPFNAGHGITENGEGTDQNFYSGGNRLVSSILLAAFLSLPVIVFIVDKLVLKDDMEYPINISLTSVLCIGTVQCIRLFSGIKWVCKRTKQDFNRKRLVTIFKAVLLLLLFTTSLVRLIQDYFDHVQVQRRGIVLMNDVACVVFELIQTIFLGTVIISSFREPQIHLKSPMVYAVMVFCNAGLILVVFGIEMALANSSAHEKAPSLLYTAVCEYSLYAITLWSEGLSEEHNSCTSEKTLQFAEDNFGDSVDETDPLLAYDGHSIQVGKQCYCRPKSWAISTLLTFVSIAEAVLYTILCYYDKHELVMPVIVIAGHFFYIVALVVVYVLLNQSFTRKEGVRMTPNEVILVISAICFYVYLFFELVSVARPHSNVDIPLRVVHIFRITLSMLIIYLQTALIIHLHGATEKGPRIGHLCSVWQWTDGIAALNLALWLMNCVMQAWTCSSRIYLSQYGGNWPLISHTLFSLAIFYRFHSAMLLLELAPDQLPVSCSTMTCCCKIVKETR